MSTNIGPNPQNEATAQAIARSAAMQTGRARYRKTDYESFANILRKNKLHDETFVTDRIAHDIADLFAKDCPRFDRQKFLTMAGVPEAKESPHHAEGGDVQW